MGLLEAFSPSGGGGGGIFPVRGSAVLPLLLMMIATGAHRGLALRSSLSPIPGVVVVVPRRRSGTTETRFATLATLASTSTGGGGSGGGGAAFSTTTTAIGMMIGGDCGGGGWLEAAAAVPSCSFSSSSSTPLLLADLVVEGAQRQQQHHSPPSVPLFGTVVASLLAFAVVASVGAYVYADRRFTPEILEGAENLRRSERDADVRKLLEIVVNAVDTASSSSSTTAAATESDDDDDFDFESLRGPLEAALGRTLDEYVRAVLDGGDDEAGAFTDADAELATLLRDRGAGGG